MKLEGIKLSEITDKKQILYSLTYMWNLSLKIKLIDKKNKLVVARGGE